MFHSEKRSLIRFLFIYLTSTFILFFIASWLFYISGKEQALHQQREVLKYEAEQIQSKLRILHNSLSDKLVYPHDKYIDSAIYDLDKHYIFGTFSKVPLLNTLNNTNKLYYIKRVEPYFLGAAYILVAKNIDEVPIGKLQRDILLFMFVAGIVFIVLGYYLGKLFVAPMRDTLKQMNSFIQDTTHELNTPISTILTNIEMIETFGQCDVNRRELKRIEIASKTLSQIYDDLTYLNLNHQYHRQIVPLNMSQILEERIEYFSAMTEAKHLHVIKNIVRDVIWHIDNNDAIRLIDNLISNAIKYNKSHGELTVSLTMSTFLVKDSGIGIKIEDMKTIQERFKRANNSEGGFGIGLDIVNQVVDSYGATLHIDSIENKGTEVCVQWKE